MQDSDLFAHAGLAFGGDELEPLAGTPLEEGQLLALAQEMTGLSDWGDDDSFRIGLRVLIREIEEHGPSPAHRHQFRRQIVHLLNQRLRLRDDEVRHPEVLEQRIERPVLILGLPRTGTTLTHELLSLDPAARAPLNWEYAAPWPAPEQATFDSDSRIAKVDASWDAQRAASPELKTMLPTFARMPSECNDAMMFHFSGPNFWAWMRVPQHGWWYAGETTEGLYRTHKRILQQLQWKGPRGRWTLKSPPFMSDLEQIIETYPDACLIWTHRDPSTTFVSLASLVSSLQKALLGERPEPGVIGPECRRLWTLALERGLAARRNPKVAKALIDVSYAELAADKPGTVEKIYDHFGLEFTDAYRAKLERVDHEEPSTQYTKHRYSAEEYGLDPASVRRELAHYFEEFGHLFEKH